MWQFKNENTFKKGNNIIEYWKFWKVNFRMSAKKVAKKQAKKAKPTLAPTMYMDHDTKSYFIQVELPGVKKEDVELSVSDQSFCVRGLREDVELLGCYVLAHPTDSEKAKAKFENGLLNIQIPIKKILKGKRITVE
jgi:HSP20 family protein